MNDANRPYDALAALPRALWLPGVINSVGQDAARLSHLERWREALRAGTLPEVDADFGDAAALAAMRAAVGALGLPDAVHATPDLAEQVLRTMLWHLDRLIDRPAAESRDEAIARVASEFSAEWQRDRADWEQLLALLPGLADAPHSLGELRGLLHSREWREAARLAEVMRARPDLAALIRRIGREHRAVAPPSVPQAEPGVRRRVAARAVRTLLPDAPGELRGLAHGDRLERMIPSEAQQLRHPVLRKLWRARRAEARLLHYDSVAELVDWRPDPTAAPQPIESTPAAAKRGPMLVALDTSGSMRGAPETIAKAVVLEALRVAQAEGRALRLIAFGAAGEVAESELGPTREGLNSLMQLIGQGFDGGTDVQAPIEAALRALHSQRWSSADLLVVSDGEFGCTPATLQALDAARERFGLRVQGVLIGDRETIGLMQVADGIFWVRDWRDETPTTQRAFSPVHSRSLTALFFPGALDDRARRHTPPREA